MKPTSLCMPLKSKKKMWPTFLCIPLKSKKKMKPTLLSQDLIVEILLRLPVKSLLRFKFVCKAWLSLISDPQFAKSHFDLAAAPTYRILVQPTYDYCVQSIDTESSLYNDSAVLKLPILLPDIAFVKRFRILGCCRGFIVYDSNHGNLMLWNPSTNFHKYIPYRRHISEILHGVGYDASTDDYLIIFVRSEKNYNMVPEYSMQSWVTRLEIFSLKAKSWNTLGDINFPYVNPGFVYRMTGLFLNGALHWLLSCHKTHIDVILVCDLKERRLSEIPAPQYLTMDEREIHGLGLTIMRGCLSICRNLPSYEMVEIWMMKEYRVESSWTKSIVLSTRSIRYAFFPSYFTEGGEIIGSVNYGGLAKFNDKGDLLEHQRYNKLIRCTVYRESLLLPTTI